MARFDVHHHDGPGFLLDCQSDLLSGLSTRFVVPLLTAVHAPPPVSRMNPVLSVFGEPHVMVTQFAGAVSLRELGPRVCSLAGDAEAIVGAIDILVTGV